MNARPLPVTLVACLYLAVGVIGFIAHLNELVARPSFHYDSVWIELTEFLAALCGVFLWRGKEWARWLALAWMLFHVVLSAFHDAGEFAVHLAFLIVIGWALFRPEASRYFRTP